MKRIVRIPLIGAAAIFLIFAAGIGIALMVINPNDFKPEIEAAVRKATGKELALKGDLSFSIFPGLGLQAGPAELEDAPGFGSEPFARLENISASVALLPLFRSRVEIGAVTLSGLRLKLAVNESGKANWNMHRNTGSEQKAPADRPDTGKSLASRPDADTGKPASSSKLSSVALESLTVEDALVVYTDMRSKTDVQLALPSLKLNNLKVGKKSDLSLTAAYTCPMSRPITLSLNTAFALPESMAEGIPFTAKGRLDNTTIVWEGVFALPETAEGQRLSLLGNLNIDEINIDKYAAILKKTSARTTSCPGSGKAAIPESSNGPSNPGGGSADKMPKDDTRVCEILRALFLDLHVGVRSLTAAGVPVTALKTTIKADKGLLVAKPVTMTVAEAPLATEVSLDARGNSLKTRVTGEWTGAKIGPLLKAITGKNAFSGTLTAFWGVAATGADWERAAQTLDGTVTASITDGRLPGFRLIPSGVPGLPAKTMDITDIRASGSWKLANGIARNEDLAIKSARLAAAGNGRVNIPAETLHYAVSVELPTLPELPNLTVLPVVVSGPIASPSYSIDQPALLRDTAKNLLTPASKTGGKIQKAGEKLGKLLLR